MMQRGIIATMFLMTPLSALAQDAVAPVSGATFLNIMLGVVVTLVTTVVVPLAILWGRQMMAERELKIAQTKAQIREAIDAGAQKAIGGALGKINIPEGKLAPAVKAAVVAEATSALTKNFPESFSTLGVIPADVDAKAKEIVESRLGLMDAQAAGNPVPNPSQPVTAPSTQNVTVTPNKK